MTNSTTLKIDRISGGSFEARYNLPADGSAIATAVLTHSFQGGSEGATADRLSRGLNRFGIGVLLLDGAASFDRDADLQADDASPVLDDIGAAIAALTERGETPSFLIGHSFSSVELVQVAQDYPSVESIAVIGGPLDADAGRLLGNGKRSLLVMHALKDEYVPFEFAERFFDAAAHPKSFIPLTKADHFLSGEADAAYAADMLAIWARSLVGVFQEDVKHREKHDNCTVAVTRTNSYRTEILSNGHAMLADEPRELSGTNTGPTPYGLLLGALAACTTITLRMYADRKEWPLESVHARMTHERVHADDCDCEAEDRSGLLDVIRKYVILDGPLSDSQRKRLMQIADLCPVHKTINNQPVFITTLMGEQAVLECHGR